MRKPKKEVYEEVSVCTPNNIYFTTFSTPQYVCELRPFGEDNDFVLNLVSRPNLWKRLWFYLFFGWKFKNIK